MHTCALLVVGVPGPGQELAFGRNVRPWAPTEKPRGLIRGLRRLSLGGGVYGCGVTSVISAVGSRCP